MLRRSARKLPSYVRRYRSNLQSIVVFNMWVVHSTNDPMREGNTLTLRYSLVNIFTRKTDIIFSRAMKHVDFFWFERARDFGRTAKD